jgi:hypothetical protein
MRRGADWHTNRIRSPLPGEAGDGNTQRGIPGTARMRGGFSIWSNRVLPYCTWQQGSGIMILDQTSRVVVGQKRDAGRGEWHNVLGCLFKAPGSEGVGSAFLGAPEPDSVLFRNGQRDVASFIRGVRTMLPNHGIPIPWRLPGGLQSVGDRGPWAWPAGKRAIRFPHVGICEQGIRYGIPGFRNPEPGPRKLHMGAGVRGLWAMGSGISGSGKSLSFSRETADGFRNQGSGSPKLETRDSITETRSGILDVSVRSRLS